MILLGSLAADTEREVGWGLRCLLGINCCESKCEGGIGQRGNSERDAGAAKASAQPMELDCCPGSTICVVKLLLNFTSLDSGSVDLA